MTPDRVRGRRRTEIEEKIAMYELELARLMATDVFINIQRLRGAIAALRELKGEEGDQRRKGGHVSQTLYETTNQ